ncbi:hypothetical protein [Paenibacillus alginolyticus]|uniref:BclA C-terminal domain-containing protein n=1 Tax=Paenibacillus alginolyticus TaxID=59839 RepID=A0ABT4GDU5_9BACL|nr:hypothetical protein [Paenibacillus alginolyticus]MCY9694365.1 hypothetical protein [Paenibacillus alginolyticus]MEC0147534.1 hypothetical protein [Paenibacillus alginolyticus]
MGIFLDSQISQNISTTGGTSIPLTAAGALFGTLGLNTAAAGPNLRIQFTASVALAATVAVAVPVTITIFRGVGPGAVLIYSATQSAPAVGAVAVLANSVFTVTGADHTPPNPGFLVYQAFISFTGLIALAPTRIGPESFNAAAYSD